MSAQEKKMRTLLANSDARFRSSAFLSIAKKPLSLFFGGVAFSGRLLLDFAIATFECACNSVARSQQRFWWSKEQR
jgi:hypothetical protein